VGFESTCFLGVKMELLFLQIILLFGSIENTMTLR
jgi:hypothetical protein